MSRTRRLRRFWLILVLLLLVLVSVLSLLFHNFFLMLWDKIPVAYVLFAFINVISAIVVILNFFSYFLRFFSFLRRLWNRIRTNSKVQRKIREKIYVRISSLRELSKAVTSWDDMCLENPIAQGQLQGYSLKRFFEQLFLPPTETEPINFESGHRMYLIVGPLGVGKSLFLLYNLYRWLESSRARWWHRCLPWAWHQSFKRHVLFLSPHHYKEWAQGIAVKELENALLVLDGAWRSGDTREEFRERMNNLARIASGAFQEGDSPALTISGRVVITMREEDFKEIRRHPPAAWPDPSRICQIRLRPFKPNDPRFQLLIERYAQAFKVNLGKQKRQAVDLIAKRSEGSPIYVAALCAQFQGKSPSLVELHAMPESYANLIIRGIASRFWDRGCNEALCFTLCLLFKAFLPLSRSFLRIAWEEFKGNLALLKDFLERLCASSDKEAVTLTGHSRAIIHQILSEPKALDPLKGMAEIISAYYKDCFDADLKRFVTKILKRIKTSDSQETYLLGNIAALGQPFLKDATAVFETVLKERGDSLEKDALSDLKGRFYVAWARAARIAWGSDRYREAISSYEQAFKFISDIVDANMHRLNLHAWASLTRKHVLPVTPQQERSQLIEKIHGVFSEILELERKLQITDPATINEYAHFLWEISDYPYEEAEKWFQKAVEAVKERNLSDEELQEVHKEKQLRKAMKVTEGSLLAQVRQRIIVKQAYAIFLWRRAQEALSGNDIDFFERDLKKAEKLFNENYEELENIRIEMGGFLPVELQEVDGAHLCAQAEFYRIKANYVARQDWRLAQDLDRHAIQLLKTAVGRYPQVARLRNALAVALWRTAALYLPEYRKRWYKEAMEHLEKAYKISLEHKQYYQASVIFNTKMAIAIRRNPFFHELEREALEVLEWDIPKRQKAMLHNTMADLYHTWFLQESATGRVEHLRELLRKAHEHLNQAWQIVPRSSENYEHLVRVFCKFARHCQLANNPKGVEYYLQKALDLAQSAASLSRTIQTVCQIGEELLNPVKGRLDYDPQAALALFELCAKRMRNLRLPRIAITRLRLDMARAMAKLAKEDKDAIEKVISMCLENAREENTDVGYGVYRHILGEIKRETKDSELKECLTKSMLSLSREAYNLSPKKSINCFDLANDLLEMAILLRGGTEENKKGLLQEADQYLQEALDCLEKEHPLPEEYHRFKSRILQQRAKVSLLLGKKNEAEKLWEEAVLLEQRPRGFLEFADRCLLPPPRGFGNPNKALCQYQRALETILKQKEQGDEDAIEWLASNLPRFLSSLTNVLSKTVWNELVRKLAFLAVIFQKPNFRASQAAWAGRLAERKGDKLLWWYSDIIAVRWTSPNTEYYERNWFFLRKCAQALNKKEETIIIDNRLQNITYCNHSAEYPLREENFGKDTVKCELRHAILEELRTMHTERSPLASFQKVACFIKDWGLDAVEDDFLDVLFIVDALQCYNDIEGAISLLETLANQYPDRHHNSLPYRIAVQILRFIENQKGSVKNTDKLRKEISSKRIWVECPLCLQ